MSHLAAVLKVIQSWKKEHQLAIALPTAFSHDDIDYNTVFDETIDSYSGNHMDIDNDANHLRWTLLAIINCILSYDERYTDKLRKKYPNNSLEPSKSFLASFIPNVTLLSLKKLNAFLSTNKKNYLEHYFCPLLAAAFMLSIKETYDDIRLPLSEFAQILPFSSMYAIHLMPAASSFVPQGPDMDIYRIGVYPEEEKFKYMMPEGTIHNLDISLEIEQSIKHALALGKNEVDDAVPLLLAILKDGHPSHSIVPKKTLAEWEREVFNVWCSEIRINNPMPQRRSPISAIDSHVSIHSLFKRQRLNNANMMPQQSPEIPWSP